MNVKRGRTIQIYLPTGEPRGIRIAEMTTRIVQTMLIPQNQLKTAKLRPEMEQIAVRQRTGDPGLIDIAPRSSLGARQSWRSPKRRYSHQLTYDGWNGIVCSKPTQSVVMFSTTIRIHESHSLLNLYETIVSTHLRTLASY